MAAAPCWTWNSNDEPPVIVPSIYRWSTPKYSAIVTASSIIISAAAGADVTVDLRLRRRSPRAPAAWRALVLHAVEVLGLG